MNNNNGRRRATHAFGVMQPTHPRWREFVERLEGPEGCNFVENEKGETTWRCEGGKDKSLASGIMEAMGDLDVAESLNYFESHGAHCDCEILFNVRDQTEQLASSS